MSKESHDTSTVSTSEQAFRDLEDGHIVGRAVIRIPH